MIYDFDVFLRRLGASAFWFLSGTASCSFSGWLSLPSVPGLASPPIGPLFLLLLLRASGSFASLLLAPPAFPSGVVGHPH